jgi:hypothetical protein
VTVNTLFGQAGGGTLAADTGNYTMGAQFSVSQSGCTLTGIWFYSAALAGNRPSVIALYAVSGATLVHQETPTWSGAAGSGWIRASFSSPPSLTSGTNYVAAVFCSPGGVNWYSSTAHYWDSGAGSGGITSGPLSAPNSAGSVNGQDVFHSGAQAFPGTTFNATNYWVDPEVTSPGTPRRPR